MLNSEERLLRNKQLGASEIHKIMNFDNKGALDLWKLKLGLIEDDEFSNIYTTIGNLTEEDTLRFFFDNYGIEEYTLNERVEHPEVKGLVASTDAIFNNIPVENKTINMQSFLNLKISRNYYLQVQTQIACCNAEYGIIVFNAIEEHEYLDPLKYKPSLLKQEWFQVDRDEDTINEILKRAKYFLWCLEYNYEPSENHYITRTIL